MRLRLMLFLFVNGLGGTCVLGSYAVWLANPAHDGALLWGNLPPGVRPLYTASMLIAAAGYLATFGYLAAAALPRLLADELAVLHAILTGILFPSALWMPLAFEYLATPSPSVWWAMRGVLITVGISSIALVIFLSRTALDAAPAARRMAMGGAIAFTFQTAILDAFLWPCFFPGHTTP